MEQFSADFQRHVPLSFCVCSHLWQPRNVFEVKKRCTQKDCTFKHYMKSIQSHPDVIWCTVTISIMLNLAPGFSEHTLIGNELTDCITTDSVGLVSISHVLLKIPCCLLSFSGFYLFMYFPCNERSSLGCGPVRFVRWSQRCPEEMCLNVSLAVGNVCVGDGWTAGMLWRKNPSDALLCLLKDSDPLQQREIRLMALVERGGKMLSVYQCAATGTEG